MNAGFITKSQRPGENPCSEKIPHRLLKRRSSSFYTQENIWPQFVWMQKLLCLLNIINRATLLIETIKKSYQIQMPRKTDERVVVSVGQSTRKQFLDFSRFMWVCFGYIAYLFSWIDYQQFPSMKRKKKTIGWEMMQLRPF